MNSGRESASRLLDHTHSGVRVSARVSARVCTCGEVCAKGVG